MSIYNTDLIGWISVSTDENGIDTDAAEVEIVCQYEKCSELIAKNDGQEVQSNCLIFIDDNVAIKEGDIILLKSKFGTLTGDTREYSVIKVDMPNDFSFSHLEVWI